MCHLQYADDTLIMCGNSHHQIWVLRCVLRCFEAVSSLRMNLGKSMLVGVGEVPDIDSLAANLGCKVESLPLSYLGLSLGASFKRNEAWGLVVDRVRRKLVGWKVNYLSRGGRVTLIKAVVANVPVYFMPLFVIPSRIAQHIKQLQRDLQWRGGKDGRSLNLVAWDIVCSPMSLGVLELRRL